MTHGEVRHGIEVMMSRGMKRDLTIFGGKPELLSDLNIWDNLEFRVCCWISGCLVFCTREAAAEVTRSHRPQQQQAETTAATEWQQAAAQQSLISLPWKSSSYLRSCCCSRGERSLFPLRVEVLLLLFSSPLLHLASSSPQSREERRAVVDDRQGNSEVLQP